MGAVPGTVPATGAVPGTVPAVGAVPVGGFGAAAGAVPVAVVGAVVAVAGLGAVVGAVSWARALLPIKSEATTKMGRRKRTFSFKITSKADLGR